jgi:hypothetical protein
LRAGIGLTHYCLKRSKEGALRPVFSLDAHTTLTGTAQIKCDTSAKYDFIDIDV